MNDRTIKNLNECDARLTAIAQRAEANGAKFVVICGKRGKIDQDDAVRRGASKTPFPRSRHNPTPSRAFDFVPGDGKTIDWNNAPAFAAVGASLKAAAAELGIAVEYGGDWKSFRDYPHFQLSDDEKWLNGQTCGLDDEPR
jgi:peptidoglycan L-alanyl-D-glutamate endopeptidase CwlK